LVITLAQATIVGCHGALTGCRQSKFVFSC
jgi:hypothetical protein